VNGFHRIAGLDFRVVHRAFVGFVLASLIAYFIYTQWIEPVPYYAVRYDPEMQYFSNSLALFKGVSYAYVDHPGTPLEVIGSFLLALTRPWTRGQSALFIPYHLEHPEVFLTMGHALIAFVSLVTVTLLMTRAWPIEGWGSLLASLGVGISYFAVYAPLSFRMMDWWTHNALNLPFGTLLLLSVILRIRRSDRLGHLEVLAFTLLAGLLVSVQLYFVAWAIGVVLIILLYSTFHERRAAHTLLLGGTSVIGLAMGFFIGFAPVLHRFREFYLWVQRLIFHQGRYGQGAEGITTKGQLVDNLLWLWNRGEVVFISSALVLFLLFGTIIISTLRSESRRWWWAAVIGVLIQCIVILLLIAKHPGVNYLVSVAALLPIIIMLAIEPFLHMDSRFSLLPGLAGIVLLSLYVVSFITALVDNHNWREQVLATDAAIVNTIDEITSETGKSREELTILWGYGVPSRCYALRYGNSSTEGSSLSEEIDEMCPNEYVYDVWIDRVMLPRAYESIGENSDWDLLIVPERFIPDVFHDRVRLTTLELWTRNYGRVAILQPMGNLR
jgi:hypothetical protein